MARERFNLETQFEELIEYKTMMQENLMRHYPTPDEIQAFEEYKAAFIKKQETARKAAEDKRKAKPWLLRILG